jgi:alpha-ketoglutarate-dependent 2,4-dichlorophenoxyacetate dioxygenase
MDDTAHVEFSKRFGELDDIRPYMTNGRKLRYQYYELFDAGNVDEDNNVIQPSSPKAQYQKVCQPHFLGFVLAGTRYMALNVT